MDVCISCDLHFYWFDLLANFIIDVIVGSETFDIWMSSSAYIVVLLAAFIGAIPGCGGMITVAVAYITISKFSLIAWLH